PGSQSRAAEHGVTDQPVELDRLIGAIDCPANQIPVLALRCRNARTGAVEGAAIGRERDLAVDVHEDVEIGLFADELRGDRLVSRANPVKPYLHLLTLDASDTDGADCAKLDLGSGEQRAVDTYCRRADEFREDDDASRLVRVG